MVDFHSHVLPGIDDGSKSVEESLQLLKLLAQQGVTAVMATPHFYADEQSVQQFLAKRQKAYLRLKEHWQEGFPTLRLGAEVRYYPGISRLRDLEKLCIEGTSVLLLEMPMTKWSQTTLQEVREITNMHNLTVVLAHVERYAFLQRSQMLYDLLDAGVLFQVNASSFADCFNRYQAFRLMKRYGIHLLGSDCHNIHRRPPRMGEATQVIGKKYGKDLLAQMTSFAQELVAVF